MINYKPIFDFSVFGELDNNGQLKILTGEEAVFNALRIWVASFRGEILRNISRGGYITYWLLKPMTDENTENLRQAIEDGLYEDFYPSLRVQQLSVIPDYERELWKIELQAYVPYLKDNIYFEEELRRIR